MKKTDLIVLGLSGVAVLLILKAGSGGSMPRTLTSIRNAILPQSTGLSYAAPAGYGDTSKYDNYATSVIKSQGTFEGWGIE